MRLDYSKIEASPTFTNFNDYRSIDMGGDVFEYEIFITQGQSTLVDEKHFDKIMRYRWHATWNQHTKSFYVYSNATIDGRRTSIRLHRLIAHLEGDVDCEAVDHGNRDTTDNRLANLTFGSTRVNLLNTKRKTSSVYPGVYRIKHSNKWRSYIKIDGKQHHLGYFVVEEHAAQAYYTASRALRDKQMFS